MMQKHTTWLVTWLALTWLSLPIAATTSHASQNGQHAHSSHVHGRLTLQLVQDKNQLLLSLLSPAANLLAGNQRQQTNALAQAKAALSDARRLFAIKPSGCKLSAFRADFTSLDDWVNQRDSGTQVSHSDVAIDYEYQCQSNQPLRTLTTSLLDYFPAIEVIEVQWLVNGRQGASTLDNSQRQIQFR